MVLILSTFSSRGAINIPASFAFQSYYIIYNRNLKPRPWIKNTMQSEARMDTRVDQLPQSEKSANDELFGSSINGDQQNAQTKARHSGKPNSHTHGKRPRGRPRLNTSENKQEMVGHSILDLELFLTRRTAASRAVEKCPRCISYSKAE